MSEAYPELYGGLEALPEALDCRDIEGNSCYLDPQSEAELRRRMASRGNAFVKWIDSGDFHYLTRLDAPLSGVAYNLILFDHHPDMQPPALGRVLSCGGWLRTLLEEDLLLKNVQIIGINPSLEGETGGFGDRVSVITRDELDKPYKPVSGLPVYISIDKDVLSPEFARTDWDQGTMTQFRLFEMLRAIFEANSVLGIDICGELTSAKGGREQDRQINRSFNAALSDFITIFERLTTTP